MIEIAGNSRLFRRIVFSVHFYGASMSKRVRVFLLKPAAYWAVKRDFTPFFSVLTIRLQ